MPTIAFVLSAIVGISMPVGDVSIAPAAATQPEESETAETQASEVLSSREQLPEDSPDATTPGSNDHADGAEGAGENEARDRGEAEGGEESEEEAREESESRDQAADGDELSDTSGATSPDESSSPESSTPEELTPELSTPEIATADESEGANSSGSDDVDATREIPVDDEAETLESADDLSEVAAAPLEVEAQGFAPFAFGDSTAPNAYFSLRQTVVPGASSGDSRGTITASIDKYSVNPSGPALLPQSGSNPTQSVQVTGLENDRQADLMPAPAAGANQVQYRVRASDFGANSLGVAADGAAYFTTQFYQEQRQRSAHCSSVGLLCTLFGTWEWRNQDWGNWSTPGTGGSRYLSIWQVNLETGVVSQPVVRTTTDVPASATLTGGAVRSDGRYHFSYLEAGGTNAITYRVYRLVGATPSIAVTATTANNTSINSFSGDIAFDGYDNLFLLVGGTGTTSRLGMLRANQVPNTGNTTLTNVATSSLSQTSPGTNNQPAGLAFPVSGHMVWQGGVTHHLRRTVPPNAVVPPAQSYSSFPEQRDLASITRRPTFQLSLLINGSRVHVTDQFILSATPGASQQTTTVNAPDGEGAPAHLAANPIAVTRALDGSPLPNNSTNPVATVPFGLTSGPLTDLGNYDSEYACVDLTSGVELVSGNGVAGSVPISVFGNPNVECTVTLTPNAPALSVRKQAFVGGTALVDGAFIDAGTQVQYRLVFDNDNGTADATSLSFTDYLSDVLDDADFVNGSLSITPGSGLTVSGLNGSGGLIDDSFLVQGSVAEGTSATVSFSVIVKDNDDGAQDRILKPVLPPTTPSQSGGFRLSNFLVEGAGAPPVTCEVTNQLCTNHPIRAWNVTKLSQPGSGASMNVGGTPNYTIVIEKSDTSMTLNGVQVVDDLTDVLKVSSWDPTIVPPSPALPMGIYFYDASNTLVGEISAANLPGGTTLADWIPAPVYDDANGSWTLTTAQINLPANAKFAHVRFSVRLGAPQAAPGGSQNWNPTYPAEPDTTFQNLVTATSDSSGLAPNRCLVGTPAAQLPEDCTTTHTLVSNVVAFRKDGIVTDADGNGTKVEDLAGHEFIIYQADGAGHITTDLPSNACVNWNSEDQTDPLDPVGCWRFYAISSGSQIGRWRSENLAAGSYWLVETKAADQVNVNGVLQPVDGIQLLAQPIPFRVASPADASPAGSVPIVGGQPPYLRAGQMDVYTNTSAATGTIEPRCDTVNWPVACVNPTGYLMIVSDVKLGPLPLTGGPGTVLLTSIGGVIIVAALIGVWWWRRRPAGTQSEPADHGGEPI